MGADGRELSQEEAEAARAQRAASTAPRRSNADIQPGRSGPAGGHYSTAGDFLKLANAIAGHRLLDSSHAAALYGARYARGEDFRANGGGPGVNAEFSIFPSGEVLVVLSNYDPPAATEVAQHIRSLMGETAGRGPEAADWTLEVLEVGGDRQAPWVRGRSTLVSQSGRRMVTDYVGILKRGADDRLRLYIDMFAAGSPGVLSPGNPWKPGRGTR